MSILKGLGVLVGVVFAGYIAFKLLGLLLGILIPVALIILVVYLVRRAWRAAA